MNHVQSSTNNKPNVTSLHKTLYVMKNALVVLILVLGMATFANAQITNPPVRIQCVQVNNKTDYDNCCLLNQNPSDILKQKCSYYLASQGLVGSGTGTQNTNPIGGADTTGTIAPTPQASSDVLKSCNKISFDSLLDILIWLKCVIGAAIIPLIFAVAFILFLWGVINYMRNADNEKKREESKKFIYYGIIGLVVMVGIWGIVRIVTTTFGLGNTVPQLQTDCLTPDKNNPCK